MKVINNIKDMPAGYFRIHWPQYQILMDVEGYDDDVIHCDGELMFKELPTIALPYYSWMKVVRDKLGEDTAFYLNFINTETGETFIEDL
jgi:hypothetical protein